MILIKFTEIANRLDYPSRIKSELSVLHTGIINYVIKSFTGKLKDKRQIINVMNTISYCVITGDSIPNTWDVTNPLVDIDVIDDGLCRNILGDIYLMVKQIEWDLDIVDEESGDVGNTGNCVQHDVKVKKPIRFVDDRVSDKSDLYLSPPVVSRFDKDRKWISHIVDGIEYCIYYSLPLIPTTQNEISVTTDVNSMTENDLLRLFPNTFIPTRSPALYNHLSNIEYDKVLGSILPINGFTTKDIRDNVVKYPHLFRLYRKVDGQLINFFSHIEIDGELYKITDIWNDIPESKIIPYNPDFIKEYVIRRYLLERDMKNIAHTYPMYGELNPFLTLFMPADRYADYGYNDPLNLAIECVKSRISYKISRNPVMSMIAEVKDV